jgi:hypothetical protein
LYVIALLPIQTRQNGGEGVDELDEATVTAWGVQAHPTEQFLG